MGNDGGSIPTRRELVKSPTRQPTHSQLRDSSAQTASYHWTTCPLAKRPLRAPVVSDSLGRLYNKDSVLEWLLRRGDAFGDGEEVLGGRVRSLKDVVELRLEVQGGGSGGGADERWLCPVSRKELGPGARAVYLVPCGHVFAESAVKEVGASESGCLLCNTPYTPENVIPINPVEPADVERLAARMKELAEKRLTHALKKGEKSKKRKTGAAAEEPEPAAAAAAAEKKAPGGIKNAATAHLTSKVLEDEKMAQKRRKLEMSENVKSLFTSDKRQAALGKNTDFMTRGYTLPKEQKAK